MNTKKTPTIGSLEKALTILDIFSPDFAELTAKEVAGETSLSMSSAYKLLITLTKHSYLEFDAVSKKYRPGPKLILIGKVAYDNFDIGKIALPYMTSLSEKVSETIHLTIKDGFEGVYIEKIKSRNLIDITTKIGSRAKLNCGAPFKVLLAFSTDTFIEQFIQSGLEHRTPQSIQSPGDLKKELAYIRSRGYSFSSGELNEGVSSVATPVFDHTNNIIASIGIAGLGLEPGEYSELCIKTTEQVSGHLGYKGDWFKHFSDLKTLQG